MASAYYKTAAAAGVFALVVLTAPPLQAAKSAVERLDIIERKLESRGLVELMNRLDQLQQDLQEMRGELELQAHNLEKMQRQQRQQYLDIDQRLRKLDRTTTAVQPPAAAQRPNSSAAIDPGAAAVGAPPARSPGMRPAVSVPRASLPPTGAGRNEPRLAPASPALKPVARAPVEYAPGSIEQVSEEAEYNAALNALKRGQYPEAVEGFKQFIADYPNSSYADNAHYWLGETYYVMRNFDRALSVFDDLVKAYPKSNKVPGSQLKVGYIHYEKKNWPAAREALVAIAINYPGSTVARQASDRLKRMKAEGN